MRPLPFLLAALVVGATVAAIDTLAKDGPVLQPLSNAVGQASGGALGSLGRARPPTALRRWRGTRQTSRGEDEGRRLETYGAAAKSENTSW